MTSERERVAKEIAVMHYDDSPLLKTLDPDYKFLLQTFFTVADWHLKEISKAYAEGRASAAEEILACEHLSAGSFTPYGLMIHTCNKIITEAGQGK